MSDERRDEVQTAKAPQTRTSHEQGEPPPVEGSEREACSRKSWEDNAYVGPV